MQRPDLDGARTYVLGRLERELSPALTYHCIAHTRDDVLPAALRLAALEGCGADDTTVLATAALFHDLGFVERRDGHELVGARIARDVLPALGYAPAQLDAIVGMIMATRLPQSPRTLLEQLLADADLDVLGRDDFFARNDALRAEVEGGRPMADADWYRGQLAFLERHAYFTAVAAETRNAGKQRNLAELRRRAAR